MALILFSHANSFPAGTYSQLFGHLRARGYEVHAVDRFGHAPQYPVTDNWPHLVQQLADFATETLQRSGTAPFLVGHSLGGFLSLMCAALHPELAGHKVRGVLLLDAPIVGGWRASTLGVIKRAQWVGSLSPGRISQRRREHWPNAEAALEYFRHKRAFAHWDPGALQDYIAHGTQEQAGPQGTRRVLRFDRGIETAIYNTLPDNLGTLLRRHPLRCPVSFIGGTHSAEMRQVGMTLTDQLIKGRKMMLDGSHLFPMERPKATAAAIEAALLNLEPRPSPTTR